MPMNKLGNWSILLLYNAEKSCGAGACVSETRQHDENWIGLSNSINLSSCLTVHCIRRCLARHSGGSGWRHVFASLHYKLAPSPGALG